MLALILSLAGCGGGPQGAGEKPLEITICHGYSTSDSNNPCQYFATKFIEYVGEEAGDQVKFNIVGDSLAGGDLEVLEGLRFGTADMMIIAPDDMGTLQENLLMPAMPFLFSDTENVIAYLDSDIFRNELVKFEEEYGPHTLGIGINGFRQMINTKHPITCKDDLKGMKWRVPQDPLYLSTYKYLDTRPTPVSGDEMFSALQQGIVDGQCLPVSGVVSYGYDEIIDYLDVTNHMFTAWCLEIRGDLYDSLTPELQAIFDEAGRKAAEDQRALVQKDFERELKEVRDAGVAVNANVDTESMREAMAPLYDEYREKFGHEFWDASVKLIEEERAAKE